MILIKNFILFDIFEKIYLKLPEKLNKILKQVNYGAKIII